MAILSLSEEIKNKFSDDLKDTLSYIENTIIKEHPSLMINMNHILLAILENKKCNANKVMSYCISGMSMEKIQIIYYKTVKNSSLLAVKPNREVSYDNDTIKLFEEAEKEMKEMGGETIDTSHIMLSLLNTKNDHQKILRIFSATGLGYSLYLGKLLSMAIDGHNEEIEEKKEKKEDNENNKEFKRPKGEIYIDLGNPNGSYTSIGQLRGPSFGRTTNISSYCINLNALVKKKKIDPIIGRDEEIDSLMRVLNKRKKNNAVIVGSDGVGKTALCEGLAWKLVEGNVPHSMKGKTIIKADVQSMIAGTQFRGMFEERVKGLIEEIKANPKYILFIDDIQNNVKKDNETNTDIMPLLNDVLEEGDIQVIVATSFKGYHSSFDNNPSLARKFQKVIVDSPNEEDTKKILDGIKKRYEDFHNVRYGEDVIKNCIKLSKKYITERNLPDSAIDVMDEVGAMINLNNEENSEITDKIEKVQKISDKISETDNKEELNKLEEKNIELIAQIREEKSKAKKDIKDVTVEDVLKVISSKTKIPVDKLSINDKKELVTLNDRIKKSVIGQDNAIDEICRAIKRKRVGISNGKSTSFLFIGGTGVGKTLIAKKIAEEVFGDEENMVRLDMSEYNDKTAVNKLIGSNPGYVGYERGGMLTEAIKNKKHCVLLLDEIEKADKDVYNLFLQVFDEGFLTDNNGMKVDFRNVVIIMTSNTGAKASNDFAVSIGFENNEEENKKKVQKKELKKTFPPEFINRIDSIVYFNALTENNLKEIIKLELNKSKKRIQDAGYDINFNDNIIDTIYDIVKEEKGYGARPIIRAIQNEIENPLTDLILEKDLESYTFTADMQGEKIKVL